MLKELRPTPPNLYSNFIHSRRTAAGKGRSQRTLVEHTQQQNSSNTKTSKKRLPTLTLGDAPDAPSRKLPKDQDLDFHPHLVKIVAVVFELKEVLLF